MFHALMLWKIKGDNPMLAILVLMFELWCSTDNKMICHFLLFCSWSVMITLSMARLLEADRIIGMERCLSDYWFVSLSLWGSEPGSVDCGIDNS